MPRTAPPPPPKIPGKRRRKTRAEHRRMHTEEFLTEEQKMFRHKFIAEYLVDFIAVRAYWRAGGHLKTKKAYEYATNILHEPYVQKKLQELIDEAEEKLLVSRNRVISGLVREANYAQLGANHGARVSAWGKLADILKMTDKTRADPAQYLRGGVMIVPERQAADPWEARASEAQRLLKEAVRE